MSKTHITMGRQSNATRAQFNNLGKTNNPQNPSVEDVSNDKDLDFEDNLLEHGFFFLDDEPEFEYGSDGSDSGNEETDEDKLDGLTNEAEIEHFNVILFEARAMPIPHLNYNKRTHKKLLKFPRIQIHQTIKKMKERTMLTHLCTSCSLVQVQWVI
jgi:hypothetical protein